MAITNCDIEAVRSFKNLRTLNNNTNDETEEIKTRITAANHSLLPSVLHVDVNKYTEIIK